MGDKKHPSAPKGMIILKFQVEHAVSCNFLVTARFSCVLQSLIKACQLSLMMNHKSSP